MHGYTGTSRLELAGDKLLDICFILVFLLAC